MSFPPLTFSCSSCSYLCLLTVNHRGNLYNAQVHSHRDSQQDNRQKGLPANLVEGLADNLAHSQIQGQQCNLLVSPLLAPVSPPLNLPDCPQVSPLCSPQGSLVSNLSHAQVRNQALSPVDCLPCNLLVNLHNSQLRNLRGFLPCSQLRKLALNLACNPADCPPCNLLNNLHNSQVRNLQDSHHDNQVRNPPVFHHLNPQDNLHEPHLHNPHASLHNSPQCSQQERHHHNHRFSQVLSRQCVLQVLHKHNSLNESQIIHNINEGKHNRRSLIQRQLRHEAVLTIKQIPLIYPFSFFFLVFPSAHDNDLTAKFNHHNNLQINPVLNLACSPAADLRCSLQDSQRNSQLASLRVNPAGFNSVIVSDILFVFTV